MHVPIIDKRTDPASRRATEVWDASKKRETSSLDVPWSDLREQDWHWQEDECHANGVKDGLGENQQREVRDAVLLVLPKDKQELDGNETDCNEGVDQDQCAHLEGFKVLLEKPGAHKQAYLSHEAEHGIRELGYMRHVHHEVVAKGREAGHQKGRQAHVQNHWVKDFFWKCLCDFT